MCKYIITSLIFLISFSVSFTAHSADFSESVTKDLARQCFKNLEEYAANDYGRELRTRLRLVQLSGF
jgi:hypothetical protein